MARSNILLSATAEAIFWEAIVASAMLVRTMSPTLQNTRAQRNAALARNSSSIGHVIDVRYWHNMQSCTAHVRYWGKSGHRNLRARPALTETSWFHSQSLFKIEHTKGAAMSANDRNGHGN